MSEEDIRLAWDAVLELEDDYQGAGSWQDFPAFRGEKVS